MTVDDVKHARSILNEEIRKMLQEFELKTGTCVQDVYLAKTKPLQGGSKIVFVRVEVTV